MKSSKLEKHRHNQKVRPAATSTKANDKVLEFFQQRRILKELDVRSSFINQFELTSEGIFGPFHLTMEWESTTGSKTGAINDLTHSNVIQMAPRQANSPIQPGDPNLEKTPSIYMKIRDSRLRQIKAKTERLHEKTRQMKERYESIQQKARQLSSSSSDDDDDDDEDAADDRFLCANTQKRALGLTNKGFCDVDLSMSKGSDTSQHRSKDDPDELSPADSSMAENTEVDHEQWDVTVSESTALLQQTNAPDEKFGVCNPAYCSDSSLRDKDACPYSFQKLPLKNEEGSETDDFSLLSVGSWIENFDDSIDRHNVAIAEAEFSCDDLENDTSLVFCQISDDEEDRENRTCTTVAQVQVPPHGTPRGSSVPETGNTFSPRDVSNIHVLRLGHLQFDKLCSPRRLCASPNRFVLPKTKARKLRLRRYKVGKFSFSPLFNKFNRSRKQLVETKNSIMQTLKTNCKKPKQ